MKPIRIQRSRQKKQVSPNGLPIVYVGRGSKYGNPFRMGERIDPHWVRIFDATDTSTFFNNGKVATREDVIRLYKKYMSLEMSEFAESNKNKNLSCWCKLSDSCHADTLLKLWNA